MSLTDGNKYKTVTHTPGQRKQYHKAPPGNLLRH